MRSHPPKMSFSTYPHPNKLLFCRICWVFLHPKPSQRADLMIWPEWKIPFTAAARIFLPSTEPSIQSLLVNWSTDHMLFQANDDIKEHNQLPLQQLQASTTSTIQTRGRKEASKMSLVFAHHEWSFSSWLQASLVISEPSAAAIETW